MTEAIKPAKRAKKKRARRPKGTGSLFQRSSDGMWIGRYAYEDEYGKPQRAQVSSKDQVLASNKLRDLIVEIHRGTYSPQQKMTIRNWLKYWLESIVKPHVSPGSYRKHRAVINNQILGDDRAQIDDKMRMPPSPNVIRGNLKYVSERWSASTAISAYDVWKKSMKDAKAEKIIRFDPMESIRKPSPDEPTGTALSSDDARKVLLSAQESGDPMATRWAAALLLGARQGELLGLEWDRVDLDKGIVELSWQLQPLDLKEGASKTDPDRFDVPPGCEVRPIVRRWAFIRPKTKRPRMVPLPKPLLLILREYRKTAPHNDFGLVWASRTGQPIGSHDDLIAWYAALERAQVPKVRLHDARHTTATLLLEMGVEESIRMKIMGHSSVATQRGYAHVDLDVQRKALENLDGLLAVDDSEPAPKKRKSRSKSAAQ